MFDIPVLWHHFWFHLAPLLSGVYRSAEYLLSLLWGWSCKGQTEVDCEVEKAQSDFAKREKKRKKSNTRWRRNRRMCRWFSWRRKLLITQQTKRWGEHGVDCYRADSYHWEKNHWREAANQIWAENQSGVNSTKLSEEDHTHFSVNFLPFYCHISVSLKTHAASKSATCSASRRSHRLHSEAKDKLQQVSRSRCFITKTQKPNSYSTRVPDHSGYKPGCKHTPVII